MDDIDSEKSRATAIDYGSHMQAEGQRALERRAICVDRPKGHENRRWGLALSGGGIRSATFCFGVMQALGLAGLPGQTPPTPPQDEDAPEPSLLGQFDYVSTVSGGGYIGTFFISLFDRLRAGQTTDKQAARLAHNALRADPPGRIRSAAPQAMSPQIPGAWLRENARYLTPTTAGDALYGMATMMRAWFAEQYVIGTFLIMLLSLLGLIKLGTYVLAAQLPCCSAPAISATALLAGLITPPTEGVWMSVLWLLPLASTVALLIPCGCAFWMTYPKRGHSLNKAGSKSKTLVWGMFLLAAVSFFLSELTFTRWHGSFLLGSLCFALGWSALLMSIWYLCIAWGNANLATVRVRLTKYFTQLMKFTAALAYLAMIDTLAQTCYSHYHKRAFLTHAVGTVAASWLAHRFGPLLSQLGQKKKGLRIPLNLIFAVLSFVLVTLLLVFWDWVVLNIQWADFIGNPAGPADPSTFLFQNTNLVLTFVLATILVLIVGRFPEFNNLSTLAGLYSARLTRAYQGASNALRFNARTTMSSAEPLDSDHIDYAQYNANPYAPMHIINVCLNQDVDPAEQLVQRDRKGKPLAILPKVPGSTRLRFAIDGDAYDEPIRNPDVLTIGEWIGVSGAAVSTGLGRRTTAATALLLGLANVRLGRWWRSGVDRSFKTKDRNPFVRLFRAILPTQAYLMDELLAQFYGTRRDLQYLSDGGHFDNTGIYELLRADRNVGLVVACDCGADQDYAFDDLATLIRLARIDFGIDIVVDYTVTTQLSPLGEVFGSPEELAMPPSPTDTKCAILLHVFRTPQSRASNQPDMKIVLIKPRLIASAPLDVHQYANCNAPFPQQTTGDQFFDEAQWESYRKLGLEIGNMIFKNAGNGYRAALATALL